MFGFKLAVAICIMFAEGAAISTANGVMSIASGVSEVANFGASLINFNQPLILPSDTPTDQYQAVTKAYVDATAGAGVTYPIAVNKGGTGANNVSAANGSILVANGSAFVSTLVSGDISLSANGNVVVEKLDGIAANNYVLDSDLGTAAFTSSLSYATAAEGVLATNAMPKAGGTLDRKSTRLNSSHHSISYAVF